MSTNTNETSKPGRGLFATIREHVPNIYALIFLLVRVGTVVKGGTLIRDIDPWVMTLLAFGVAGVTMRMERQLAIRNAEPRNPAQSLLGIFVSYLPALTIVIGLNSLAAFSFGADALRKEHQHAALQRHWTGEKQRSDAWLTRFRAEATKAIPAAQAEVAAEQERIRAARRAGTPYPSANLNAIVRRAADARALVLRSAAISPLPVQAPQTLEERTEQINRLSRSLTDTYIASLPVLQIDAPPAAEPFAEPAVDAMTLFISETGARTPRAMGSIVIAFLLELLGYGSIALGSRRVPLAARVDDWKQRTAATWRALVRRRPRLDESDSLEISVQPHGLDGTFYLRGLAHQTAAEIWPRISATLAKNPIVGTHALNRLCKDDGTLVVGDQPLLPQLGGGPLVIVLEASTEEAA